MCGVETYTNGQSNGARQRDGGKAKRELGNGSLGGNEGRADGVDDLGQEGVGSGRAGADADAADATGSTDEGRGVGEDGVGIPQEGLDITMSFSFSRMKDRRGMWVRIVLTLGLGGTAVRSVASLVTSATSLLRPASWAVAVLAQRTAMIEEVAKRILTSGL